jgi:hypothetical protein
MWKTVMHEIGQELGLSAPNEHATITMIPIMWLPDAKCQEALGVLAEYQEIFGGEAPDDGQNMIESMRAVAVGARRLLPTIIHSWTFKDPETGRPLPSPREAIREGTANYDGGLPMAVLLDILGRVMDDGSEVEEAQPGDEPDPFRQIPLESETLYDNGISGEVLASPMEPLPQPASLV